MKGHHDFCRLLLKTTIEDMRKHDPVRFLKTEVESEFALGGSHRTYSVKVTDWHDLQTETKATGADRFGRFRTLTYKVEACCRWNARTEALNRLEEDFPEKDA